jgi:Sodium/hydrogen exchanger family
MDWSVTARTTEPHIRGPRRRSVILVVLSAVVVGLLVDLLVPGLGLAGGIALGAILSPTDAAPTAIVRRVGVTSRVTTVLEGEGLLNDATALVLLRAAIATGAASAAAVSVPGVVGQFALAVVVAGVLGVVVGRLGLAVRRRVADPTVNTVLSFATPFVASLPAEELGGLRRLRRRGGIAPPAGRHARPRGAVVRPARAEVATDAERGKLTDRLMAVNREVLDRHADDPEIAAFRERLADRDGRPDPAVAGNRVRVRLEMIEAQRAALLAAQDEGTFTSESLTTALENLDAEQISIELRSRPDLSG